MTSTDSDFAALNARLEGLKLAADETTAQTEKPISDDRRWIAQIVLWSFAVCTVIVLLATIVLAFVQPDSWEAPAKAMLAIIAQVLLPVVTLVIGFYFRSDPR